VKDTRAALVEHFKEGHFVHPSALFAPDPAKLSGWLSSNAATADDVAAEEDADDIAEDFSGDEAGEFLDAAE
jgi:ParB family chromosome partitioning protein